jgi:peptide deformylase
VGAAAAPRYSSAMSVLDIAQIGNPVLRQPARELSRDELSAPETQRFIDDLIDTMRAARGAGLAANQVHQPIRVCAIEVKDNPRYPYKPNIPLTILVNPRLEPVGDETFENYEGCLSVPNLRGLVRRHVTLRVRAWDRLGAEIDEVVRGLKAGTFQHEVDHLDGVLFLDRVADPKTLCTWDEFERHHRAAFLETIIPFVERVGS